MKTLNEILFDLELDLADAEEERDWGKVIAVIEKIKNLQKN